MRDLALRSAGVIAILVAIGHAFTAEYIIFPKARIEPAATRTLLRIFWQATALEWIAFGILLIAAPTFDSEIARRWVIAAAVVVYGYAAIGNAYASRGRHPGWAVAAAAVVLALLGI